MSDYRQLPISERLRLVERIWESRIQPDEVPLIHAQSAELDRRLKVYRDDPSTEDGASVLYRVRGKH